MQLDNQTVEPAGSGGFDITAVIHAADGQEVGRVTEVLSEIDEYDDRTLALPDGSATADDSADSPPDRESGGQADDRFGSANKSPGAYRRTWFDDDRILRMEAGSGQRRKIEPDGKAYAVLWVVADENANGAFPDTSRIGDRLSGGRSTGPVSRLRQAGFIERDDPFRKRGAEYRITHTGLVYLAEHGEPTEYDISLPSSNFDPADHV